MKILTIRGMMCEHCRARVEKVLNSLEGVKARVHLESNSAAVSLTGDVSDDTLKRAVEEAGYEVTSVREQGQPHES